jgi:hypothetical protein
MSDPGPADTVAQARRCIAAALATDPALAELEIEAAIRHVPGKRAILRGRFAGRPAVVRQFLSPAIEPAQREWAEMQRAWPEMQGRRFRIAEPLHFSAVANLIVVEAVPGTPMLELLWQSAPETRARWLEPGARWLRRYTDSSETWTRARPAGWLGRAERAAAKQPFDELRALEGAILTELHRLAAALEAADWRAAISHGDYHPNNLLVSDARLTGIDTGGSARMPLYKDMARFLMHMGRRGMIPSGRRRLGVDAQGLETFAEVFALTETERRLALPFMLGVEALIRVENAGMTRSRVKRAAEMSRAYLDDVRGLGPI